MYSYVKPPGGSSPCEATGVIDETGQEFYFRLRGGKATLGIFTEGVAANCAPSTGELYRFFREDIKSAGDMQLVQADFLICMWVRQHLADYRTARALCDASF